jgi:lipoic acid synthetase
VHDGEVTDAALSPAYSALKDLVRREGLHTVCEEAGCPNIYECWEDREATFLIGGEVCTRRCDFCQIDTGKPTDYDTYEPTGSPPPWPPWVCATPP